MANRLMIAALKERRDSREFGERFRAGTLTPDSVMRLMGYDAESAAGEWLLNHGPKACAAYIDKFTVQGQKPRLDILSDYYGFRLVEQACAEWNERRTMGASCCR